MNPTALGRLSPREAECLRLVGRLMTDKEIARALEIEPSTVKTLVGRAMRKLEVDSRAAAARALADFEGRPPQWGTDLQGGQPSPSAGGIGEAADPTSGPAAGASREARAATDVADAPVDPPPHPGGRVAAASKAQRVVLIVAATFLMVVVAIASVPLSDAVQRIADRFDRHRSP